VGKREQRIGTGIYYERGKEHRERREERCATGNENKEKEDREGWKRGQI
jgi:hypothetical protein